MTTHSRLAGLEPGAIQHIISAARALEAGQPEPAEHALAPVLAAFPDHPEVLRLHAGVLRLRGLHAAALQAMRRAAALRPDDGLYCNTLGTVLADAGDLDGAVAALRRACELQPELAAAWFNLGILLTRCVRYADAAVALRHTVALAPEHAQARAQLADLLRMSDQSEAAIAEYRAILAVRPWTGMAWWGLADIKTLRLSAPDVEAMRAAVDDTRASDDDRIATGFALAKALDDQGHYADSLQALANANAIAQRRKRWNAASFSAAIDAIGSAFVHVKSRATANQLGSEVIFVVGLPRSGTTLIEQILASHSQVEGAGELPDLALTIGEESQRRGQPYPQWVGALQAEDWQRLGRRYLERIAYWRRRRPRCVDKMPNNWMHIDAIRAMLPGAHIIVARRDRLETCLSCYRQHLAGNDYTRTFTDLAAYWHDFDRVCQDQETAHPAQVYRHVYEELLADPTGRIHALLDFCGLPFEEACLRFHETKRDIGSPSAMQVRQPLRHDTARADRYGALLNPLRSALGLPAIESGFDAT